MVVHASYQCPQYDEKIKPWKICISKASLTLKLPAKLQPYGLYVYYVVHICDFGMLRVKFLKQLISLQRLQC